MDEKIKYIIVGMVIMFFLNILAKLVIGWMS